MNDKIQMQTAASGGEITSERKADDTINPFKKTKNEKHDNWPQTHADLHRHFSPATCGTERVITLQRENPLICSFPKGSTFCFAIVGKAKSLCPSRERSERVANNPCPIGNKENLPASRVNPIPHSLRKDTLFELIPTRTCPYRLFITE